MEEVQQHDDGQQSNEENVSGDRQQPAGEKFPAEVQAILDKANREAAQARKRAQAAESRISEFEQRELTELEKREQRIAALESELNEAKETAKRSTVRAEITAAATKLGYKNPKLAYKLLDTSEVQWDDEGNPSNVENLLKDVLNENPYLSNAGGADGGRGRQPTTATSMSDRIRQAAGRN